MNAERVLISCPPELLFKISSPLDLRISLPDTDGSARWGASGPRQGSSSPTHSGSPVTPRTFFRPESKRTPGFNGRKVLREHPRQFQERSEALAESAPRRRSSRHRSAAFGLPAGAAAAHVARRPARARARAWSRELGVTQGVVAPQNEQRHGPHGPACGRGQR